MTDLNHSSKVELAFPIVEFLLKTVKMGMELAFLVELVRASSGQKQIWSNDDDNNSTPRNDKLIIIEVWC